MQSNRTGSFIFRVNQSEKCKTQLRPLPVKRQGSNCQREEDRRKDAERRQKQEQKKEEKKCQEKQWKRILKKQSVRLKKN